MDNGDLPKNLNTFLEEYLENIGDDSKEIRRDLELIQELDEVMLFLSDYFAEIYNSFRGNWKIENRSTWNSRKPCEDKQYKIWQQNYFIDTDNVEELLSKDPLFLTFKSKTDQAISISQEKVQLSQRITRLMENSLSRLSSKIDEYGEERKVVESSQSETMKSIESKSSRKKQKEEPVLMPVESGQSEEQRAYCICGQVRYVCSMFI